MGAEQESLTGITQKIKKLSRNFLKQLFSTHASDGDPITLEMAKALLERNRLSDILPYRDFDDKNKFLFLDQTDKPSLGFSIQFHPLMLAGHDAEKQLESLISRCPIESIITFAQHSTPDIDDYITQWANSRLENNDNELLRTISVKRSNFAKRTAMGISALEFERFYPRNITNYLFVKIPYLQDLDNPHSIEEWVKTCVEVRNSAYGILEALRVSPKYLDEERHKTLLRSLLNPAHKPEELESLKSANLPLKNDLVERTTTTSLLSNGTIKFKNDKRDIRTSCVTVDNYPEENFHLYLTGQLTGNLLSNDKIAAPYWMYTTIHKTHPEKAKDTLNVKLGVLNKQCMSDSNWYKSMMSHMFKRRENTMQLLNICRSEQELVRMYSGINIYSDSDSITRDTDTVVALFSKAGFKASPETNISLPVWLCSLPFFYFTELDQPTTGLQRAVMAHSMNAACATHVQGDWSGTDPKGGGPLLFTRKQQIASIDLFQTDSSYNFIVVATSGAGKSFLANELVTDILSKGGMVRLIDVGGSYARLCKIFNGQNMVFDPNRPLSINPFWGIEKEKDLLELMPVLKEVVIQMAFPTQTDVPDWHKQTIEKAIHKSWESYTNSLEMRHIYEYLLKFNDHLNRAKDMADQIEPHAIGRYKVWFNGPRELSFDNKFTIVELEQLNVDKELRNIVLTLTINTITREMYLTPKTTKKLLCIDEAWDLLGDAKTGGFIETAFRRIRKYNGAAGVITQSFEDFDKSPAAKAAFANAPWKFVLMQQPTSIKYGEDTGKIEKDPFLIDLISSVKPGPGFSEVYVKCEAGQAVYKFIVDPHTYFTFTTDPKDINALDVLEQKGMSTLQAIDHLATNKLKDMGFFDSEGNTVLQAAA